MSIALITGSAGLIGSEAVKAFADLGLLPIGIDNNMRKIFFGEVADITWNLKNLQSSIPNYTHYHEDIRDMDSLEKIFKKYRQQIAVIVHAAAQPSHDWAATNPHMDFTINAVGTLNLLELTRNYAKDAVFIYLSTNKVYGDSPNYLPLVEEKSRWEIAKTHPYWGVGIDENMSIDQSKHSLFGVSKASADLLVQEYGRYFGLKTACFRGGCLTGPYHSGVKLHGFLSYLMRCVVESLPYTVIGYQGKQVRDNIHSYDLVNALIHYFQKPQVGAVYNIGGGTMNHCSVSEAIHLCEQIADKKLQWNYHDDSRQGDHIWWVTDVRKFKSDYPAWDYKYPLITILQEMYLITQERCKTYV